MVESKYIGERFGRLTVVESRYEKGNGYFECRCECGNTISVQRANLLYGKTKSCGCMNAERSIDPIHKHRLYATWCGMRQRCLSAKSVHYENYGGRGIQICDEWANDFLAFEKWAYENGFEEGLTIDRINNDGNYEPSNCRWATYSVQNSNQRKRTPCRRYEIDGVKKTQKEWCEEYGVHAATVRYRVSKMGMTLKEALTAEKLHEGNHNPIIVQRRRDKASQKAV